MPTCRPNANYVLQSDIITMIIVTKYLNFSLGLFQFRNKYYTFADKFIVYRRLYRRRLPISVLKV